MSTGRKSQLEKFNARQAKVTAVQMQEREQAAKAAVEQKDIMKQGEKIMKETTGTENNVFAVIARDSMESFIKTWNNSMENVIKETIRVEVQKVVQSELESAVRGVFDGLNEAMTNMIPQMMPQAPVSDEPVEFDLTSVSSMEDTFNKIVPFRNPQIQKGDIEQEQIAEEWDQHQMFMAGVDADGDEGKPVKKPRYAKARIMTCKICGEQGHNRRTCPQK